MENSVTILGAKGGPAVRRPGAMPTSSLLRANGKPIVIDCGLGVTRSVVHAGTDLRDVETIFVTHLHSDHLLELGPLIHTIWTTGTKRKITVYGPPGIQEYFDAFLTAMEFDNDIRVADEGRRPLQDLVTIRILEPNVVFEFDAIKVAALRVNHPPVTDCFALRFDWSEHRVTFSADTSYFPPLAEFADHSDILVHEAMLPQGVEKIIAQTGLGDALRRHLYASHTTAEDAGRIAQSADAKHLILNHLVPPDDPDIAEADWVEHVAPQFGGKLSVGYDGLCVEIPNLKKDSPNV